MENWKINDLTTGDNAPPPPSPPPHSHWKQTTTSANNMYTKLHWYTWSTYILLYTDHTESQLTTIPVTPQTPTTTQKPSSEDSKISFHLPTY